MLRDILRLHPDLDCPEETHFFRWADPFGSPRYDRSYITMSLFEEHRKLDGVSNKDFHEARRKATNRREMADAYGALYLNARGNPDGRWFDKTPQNVYGIFLMAHHYPEALFVHIVRNPLNVVASLVEGKVMARHSVKGAVNYWNESAILVHQFRKLYAERIIEVKYESVLEQPETEIGRLCEFLGEDVGKIDLSGINLKPEQNRYKSVLQPEEIELVRELTSDFTGEYGYE
jgi:hypothetical protein